MYKRFAFEGDVHTSLDCVPLTVRRKLDLAGIKLSLVGWQRLTRDERLCLCHLPVDHDDEIDVYREVLLAFCQRRDVACKALVDPAATTRAWNDPHIPSPLRDRLPAFATRLDDERWASLDEECRYALLKLADPKREAAKLVAALVELGLVDGPAPAVDPRVAVCDSAAQA